jgi:2-polyprenyl-6-hydroxyphenyl methylase/3-demethylubiquinone-9 3-methyltransferase
MTRAGAEVVGIDMAEENLAAARAHAARENLSVTYELTPVEDLAAARPGGFDIVTCLEMLEHVPDPEKIVAACAAAVRPGGAVFFSTINRNPKSFLLAVLGAEYVLGWLPRGTHEYRKLIQPAELARGCRRSGLTVHDLRGLHFNPVSQSYFLGSNVDVNYLAHTTKAVST